MEPNGDGRSALDGVVESAKQLGVELDEAEAARWVAALESEATGRRRRRGRRQRHLRPPRLDARLHVARPGPLPGDRRDRRLPRPAAHGPHRAGALRLGRPGQGPVVPRRLRLLRADPRHGSHPRRCLRHPGRRHPGQGARDARRVPPTGSGRSSSAATRSTRTAAGTRCAPGAQSRGPPTRSRPAGSRWSATGSPETLTWEQASADPGWCKLDWIVADPARRALANASNMLDVTWEAPDGTITALDGFIDPYFQEVYLEAESLPLFTRLVGELSADAVDDYVDQLEHEVVKYTTKDPNYGKVARRLYNIFRLTGRYAEAAYLRELFDEPTTVLYQVAAQIRTLDEADRPGAEFDYETLVKQTDALIMSAIAALDGRSEAEMVRHLMGVRNNLRGRRGTAGPVGRGRRGQERGAARRQRLLRAPADGRPLHQGVHRRPRRARLSRRVPVGERPRLFFLDNLRAFAIVLVIVLHASITYMLFAPAWWYVLDPDRSLFFTVRRPARGRPADARPVLRGRVLRPPVPPAARRRRLHPGEGRAAGDPVGLRGRLPGPAGHLHDLRLARHPDGLLGLLDPGLLGADVPAVGLLVPGRPVRALPGPGLGPRGEPAPAGQRAPRRAAASARCSWPSSR